MDLMLHAHLTMVLLLGHESLELLKLRPDAVFDGLQAYMNRGRVGVGRVKGGREAHLNFTHRTNHGSWEQVADSPSTSV